MSIINEIINKLKNNEGIRYDDYLDIPRMIRINLDINRCINCSLVFRYDSEIKSNERSYLCENCNKLFIVYSKK